MCCQDFHNPFGGVGPDACARAGEMKKALRTVIERYELPVRLTANQNLILTAIDPSWKADILATLTAAGVKCASSPCLVVLDDVLDVYVA